MTREGRSHRVTRAVLGTLAALGLLAALATSAAAGGKNDPGSFGEVVDPVGSEVLTAAALPTDQFSLNKASPKLFLATVDEESPTRRPNQ